MNDFDQMWDFDVMKGVSFPHCNRVHPIMQRRVQKLLEILTTDSNIKEIVLFGSSLDFRCNSYSDLDVYIEKYNPNISLNAEPLLDCEVDILMDLKHESRLYQEIDKKGLLLYEGNNKCVM